MKKVKTIALTGLPSEQKSRLYGQLKEKSNSFRQSVNLIDTNLTYDEITNTLQQHIEQKKQQFVSDGQIQLQNLDLLSTLVWMDIHFNKYPLWLANSIKNNAHYFYLVIADDLSMAVTTESNSPSLSALFQDKLYHYLNTFNLNYSTINGKGDALLRNALLEYDFSLGEYNGFTFFMDPSSPLSQWHPSEFEVDGISFCCGEQFMMYQKAMLFNDLDMANKIMATSHPNEHQTFGRAVKGFNSKIWKQYCRDIVYKGNYAKFTQNEWLWEILDNTKDSLLVEAYDQCTYWSVGLVEANPTIKNPQLWPGKNWIGFILTRVREEVRQSFKTKSKVNQNSLCEAKN